VSEGQGWRHAHGDRDQTLIRNCRFAFRCHQRWQSLEHTADPRLRYCHECSREVVLCRRDEDLREALQANQCVAIETAAAIALTHTVGVIDLDGFTP
jgi:hypothetical protein